MSDYYRVLRRSLTDRAQALGSYVSGLKAGITRTDDGFALALEMCRTYTDVFTEQVNFDWNEARRRPDEQRAMLNQHLARFLERERWIDQRFTRGSQDDVPRALRSIAKREFARHGLIDHEPVLTVGAPDSFETHKSDLFSFLFNGLFVAANDARLDRLRYAPKLSVISVPYIEGTRALWHPIIVGHEIAHVRLDHARGLRDRAELTAGWLSPRDDDWIEIQLSRMRAAPQRASPRLDVQRVLERWVDELLCDLNAVRLFGPAGLSAIAEFLVLLDAGGRGADRATETHPPLSVRLIVLFEYVRALGYQQIPDYAQTWESFVEASRLVLDQESRLLVRLITDPDHISRMIDHVSRWGPACSSDAHGEAVAWVAGELLDGIPGGTHLPGGSTSLIEVSDVVNAAWAARAMLDEAPSPMGALAQSDLSNRVKRLRIDSLASKAIDSIELAALWGRDRGMIGLDDPVLVEAARLGDQDSIGPMGVLSGGSIASRLLAPRSGAPRRAMAVTPLFADTLQDAGIDVRLGPDFIVFRHSSTAAFDPVDMAQDPRVVQERVHKGWGERFILHPGELVLASTLEYIVLPDDVAAQVVTRSSYGRLGLLTATAVQIQPGSRGCITLELVNHSQTPIALAPGVRVGQLMIFAMSASRSVLSGRYWFPVGPEFSKVHEDKDASAVERIAPVPSAAAGGRPITFSFAADATMASAFEDLVRREQVDLELVASPLSAVNARPDERGIGPSEVALLVLTASAAISTVANIAFKWRRETRRSLLVQETGDGSVDFQVLPDDAPSGLVIVKDRNGIEVERVSDEGMAADVADALARIVGRGHP